MFFFCHLSFIPVLSIPRAEELLPSPGSSVQVSDWLEKAGLHHQFCWFWRYAQVSKKTQNKFTGVCDLPHRFLKWRDLHTILTDLVSMCLTWTSIGFLLSVPIAGNTMKDHILSVEINCMHATRVPSCGWIKYYRESHVKSCQKRDWLIQNRW